MNATESVDKTGRPWLVLTAKGSYTIPDDFVELGEPQTLGRGLLYSDIFEGEAGLSAPLLENDMVPHKALCDVIVRGSAHAPQGKPVTELTVGLMVGPIKKSIRVVGNRHWIKGLVKMEPSRPEPFLEMPITYSRASGGIFTHQAIGSNDPNDHLVHPQNYVGCGYGKGKFLRLLDGRAVPNLEAPDMPVTDPEKLLPPVGFGPIARNWAPRIAYGGTYDQRWREEVFPLLPADFDEKYYQSAPADQQMPYPKGGEEVSLLNMKPGGGLIRFKLPDLILHTVVLSRKRVRTALDPKVDTIVIDTDENRVDLVWRVRMPLDYGLSEIHTVVSGKVCKRWWEATVFGKPDCGCGGVETNDQDLIPVTEALA
ncbi:MAG: DUF2169 domain-containing protein [Polyangiaceae bacterium]|nr:DUF2169 domain-containing protein [Polyangiaceae bacterium]